MVFDVLYDVRHNMSTLNQPISSRYLGFRTAAPRSEAHREPAVSCLSSTTMVLGAQLVWFGVRMAAGHFVTDLAALAYAGIALSALGIGIAASPLRAGDRRQGWQCAAASAAMLFFWYLQFQLPHSRVV